MPQKRKSEPFIPIYRQLASRYVDSILSLELKPGDRIHSISEIQARHKVSRETAKFVLKILAKEGYIVQRAGKGSYVADLGAKKKVWGIILPFYTVLYDDLLHRLKRHSAAMNRELIGFLSHNTWQEEIRIVGRLLSERYEAIIVIPTLDESKTASFYRRLSPKSSLVTLLDHSLSGSYFPYVIQSYDLGVQRGIRHLLGVTRRAVAFVRNEIWAGHNMLQELMIRTYNDILEAERPEHPPLVIESLSSITGAYLQKHAIDGLFITDDADAIRIIGRLHAEGVRIPEDLRIISYGNTELAQYFSPGITSIDSHAEEMAARAIEIIRKGLDQKDIRYCQYVIKPDLIVRET